MKRKVLWLGVSFLLVAALVLASCAEAVPGEQEEEEEEEEEEDEVVGPEYGGTLYMAPEWQDVSTFDRINRYWQTARFMSFTHDTAQHADWYIDREIADYLFWNDAGAREELWVGGWAETWEQIDPLHYVFNVRQNMVWHDKPPVNGREFVANDVVMTFERLLASPVWAGHPIAYIEEITAPDKYTVNVTTRQPFFNLVHNMCEVQICAHECWEEQGDLSHWTTAIGTGPYMLEEYVRGSHFSLIKNPDYWDIDPRNGNQLPYIEGIELFVMPEAATQFAALSTAKIDMDDFIRWTDKPALEAAAPDLLWAANPDMLVYLIWQKNSIEPFSNVKVRQAMRMAVDMEEIRDTVFPEIGLLRNYPVQRSLVGMYTPWEELSEATKKVLTYDPVAARALLAETPWPDGFDTTIQYTIEGGGWAWSEDALVMIQDYWSDIGINAELEVIDPATASSFRSPPHGYKALFASMGGGHIFPILNNYFKTGAIANRCCVSDPYIDEIVDKVAEEFDMETRNAMYREVFEYVEQQAIYMPLPQGVSYTAWWPWVKEYSGEVTLEIEGYGKIVASIWLDQDLREEITGER